MALLVAIGKFFGAILKAMFPNAAERLKERRSAKYAGRDAGVQADMEKSLEKDLGIDDNSADSTEPDDAVNS